MKNQSSLNDVFRFVELKPSNILKAYPLIETDKISSAKSKCESEKISIARKFLNGFKDVNSGLNYGREMKSELDAGIDDEETTVEQFYNAFKSTAGTDIGSDDYISDLELLSEIIYFFQYVDSRSLTKDNLNLYLAYQVLLKAKNNDIFKTKKLNKILGLESNDAPFIKNVGVADLLVVKQHLLRYEETEIAHIENVMKGETRSREHRYLDRFEETLIYENEKSVETEKESETTERFKMNRETSNTIQEDQKFSADLSISGKWGPVVEFSNNLAFSSDVSETNEINTSSEYAKDIMDRSLEKINERVRTERITKIIKENETKDLHSFVNVANETTAVNDLEQISGIYQFVDKIYKAQVFNYGQRQMFDLMIPEPASYLWHLNKGDIDTNMENGLLKPKKFDINPFELVTEMVRGFKPSGDIFYVPGKNHYSLYVSLYQAIGVKPPPSDRTITMSLLHPELEKIPDGRSINTEKGIWLSPASILDINIPAKYLPKKLDIDVLGLSDTGGEVKFTFQCANDERRTKTIFYDNSNPNSGLTMLYSYDKAELMSGKLRYEFEGDDYKTILSDKNVLKLSYFAVESANHAITLKVECEPSEELIQEWQLETYDILQTAYQNRLIEYESKLAQFNADRKAQENFEKSNYGVPPSKQKQVMLTELKKHAISIFTNNYEIGPNFMTESPLIAGTEAEPPKINTEKSKIHGDHIRFFEHAFEWSQMQYALYPYFWSDYGKWESKFKTDDPNYEYQQFLQASAARLVLPVRPKFEEAVAHYLETGEPWNGEGVPEISDPLYVSIIAEIKEKSGVTDKEPTPEGEPWEVRMPTSLIKLKADDNLPKWKVIDGGVWEWEIND